jgi:inhibitor of KinA
MIIPRIYSIHDRAITIEFSQIIHEQINMQVIAWQQEIESNPFPGFIECVPAYSSLTIYFGADCNIVELKNELQQKINIVENTTHLNIAEIKQVLQPIEIPVCYDIEFGFDLPWLTTHLNMSIEEIIQLHIEKIYRVYMIGFIPGFPYMGILPPKLEVPRKHNPSLKIPAGSIGIAGKQTGIYPTEIPGGWQIIGRTPLIILIH